MSSFTAKRVGLWCDNQITHTALRKIMLKKLKMHFLEYLKIKWLKNLETYLKN